MQKDKLSQWSFCTETRVILNFTALLDMKGKPLLSDSAKQADTINMVQITKIAFNECPIQSKDFA